MRIVWTILWVSCGLCVIFFTIANALHLWGFLGAFLAVVTVPIAFLVVPIALLIQGEMPVYWLLVPAASLFFYLAHRGEE